MSVTRWKNSDGEESVMRKVVMGLGVGSDCIGRKADKFHRRCSRGSPRHVLHLAFLSQNLPCRPSVPPVTRDSQKRSWEGDGKMTAAYDPRACDVES